MNQEQGHAPITDALGRYIAGSATAPIPEEFRELGRRHILDTLAAIVASRDLEPAVTARRFAIEQSGDARRNAATILSTHERAALADAVFASAMTGHAAEINDFIPSAFVQPGPAIVSAAVLLAERRRKSGEAVLRAVIVGYELAGRIPKALGSENLRRAGIANHGIGPVFGTAAAAASIIGLTEDRIGDVLSYCVQQASGSWQWLFDVEHIEKSFVFAGMGARAGLNAALMVEAGFRGVRACLDRPDGWMHGALYCDGDSNPGYLTEGLGERTELHHTAYKRYPVGGPTQPAVEGLLRLLPEIDRSAVSRVVISMPGRWQTFRDAAMPALNLRYLCAIILIDGRLDFVSAQSLDRMRNDADVRALMTLVEVRHDADQEVAGGRARTESARVEIGLANGSLKEVYVPYVLGFPSHPMGRADVESKAVDLMVPLLGAARAKAIVDSVWNIERMDNAGHLATLIAR